MKVYISIALLNKETFDMTRIRFLKVFVRWWIVDFEIEFSKYYLMMAILVKSQDDTQTHHPIWLIQDTDCP